MKDNSQREAEFAGQRWGRLVAISPMGYQTKVWNGKKDRKALWLFRCDCGKQKIMPINNVRYNNVRSCGCLAMEHVANLRKANIAGQQFGRLTAIRPTEKRTKNGSIVWELSCECGNIVFKTVNELKTGRVLSCGCLYKETRSQCTSYRKDFIENTSISSMVASKRPCASNKSGYTGVFLNKRNGRWQAYITYQRKRYDLGSFIEMDEAIQARKAAEKKLHDPVILEHWENLTEERKKEFEAYLSGVLKTK